MRNFLDPRLFVRARPLLLLVASASPAVGASGITITSPQEGTVVAPGSQITVTVEVDPSLSPTSVSIVAATGQDDGQNIVVDNSPPFEGTFTIPLDTTGPVEITTFVEKADGSDELGPTVVVNVVPTDSPVRLEAYISGRLRFGSTGNISVIGIYANGARREIAESEFGTTYTVADPTVATVDEDGATEAVGAGATTVTVSNSGKTAYVLVRVAGPAGSPSTHKEVTAQVAVAASGFRRDRETGLFVQALTIKNNASVPLPAPLRLVISDLPEGVSVENDTTRTKMVEPLDSAVVRIVPPPGSTEPYLAPGATATAQVTFRNRNGVPITYRARVFRGARL